MWARRISSSIIIISIITINTSSPIFTFFAILYTVITSLSTSRILTIFTSFAFFRITITTSIRFKIYANCTSRLIFTAGINHSTFIFRINISTFNTLWARRISSSIIIISIITINTSSPIFTFFAILYTVITSLSTSRILTIFTSFAFFRITITTSIRFKIYANCTSRLIFTAGINHSTFIFRINISTFNTLWASRTSSSIIIISIITISASSPIWTFFAIIYTII